MPVEKYPNAEPIRGYRLIEPLGSGGFGEVWKCEAPGGIHKAIKFVYGNLNGLSTISRRAECELRSVQHIKSIRHPFLLAIDRVENVGGELVIVTELADKNLHQLWTHYRGQGLPGIPRDELLAYLRETAEVLDMLNLQANLQHLDIKPSNLFLVSNHVKVADFGLVQSLTLGQAALQMGAITPLYAAPEIFLGVLSRHCDQYSLAIVFQEMLTGTLPFDGKNARQLLMLHTQAEPNLEALPPGDRVLVARALHKNPEHRFSSCMEFIKALAAEGAPSSVAVPTKFDSAMDIHLTPTPVRTPSHDSINLAAAATTPNTASATQPAPEAEKDRLRPRPAPNLPAGFLPDFSFLDCQSSGPLAESWRIQSPDGHKLTLEFLYGCDINDPKSLKEISTRLLALHHPGLLPLDKVHAEPGRLIVVHAQTKETLRDRLQECRARKQQGIPRGEMIDYIRAAAEVLDYLFQQHSLQHLGLNPRNLVLDHGYLQLAEFGIAQIVWLPSNQDIAQRNPRYAAPELFGNQLNRFCDQYSLAVIFAEMVTGQHPFQGQNQRRRGEPDLSRLASSDRDIIARALDPDPAKRWPSTTDLALALEGSHPDIASSRDEDSFAERIKTVGFVPFPLAPDKMPANVDQKIADLVASLGGQVSGTLHEQTPVLNVDDLTIEHRFPVGIPLGSALLQLENLTHHFGARIISHDDRSCTLHVDLPGTLWQRMRGKQPALEIQLRLSRIHPMTPTPIEIHTLIRTLHYADPMPVLEGLGRAFLERIRQHFMVNAEKRAQERLPWPHPVVVLPLYSGGQQDEPISCRGKEISLSGMGLFLPHELDTTTVMLQIPNNVHGPYLSVPATLVRAHRCADGWYDAGAMFHFPVLRKSSHAIHLAAASS